MERFFAIFSRLAAAVLAAICAGLFAAGLIFTIIFRQYQENDYPDVHYLNPAVMLAAVIICLILLGIVLRASGIQKKSGEPKLSGRTGFLIPDAGFAAVMVFAAIFCAFLLFVIRGLPTNDAKILYGIAQDFLSGDYSAMGTGYLTVYPFQLSYVLISEWLTLAFGPGNYLIYQILNVISILLSIFFLYELTWELTKDARAASVMSVMSFGCLVLYVYCTFIYNDIWSLAPLYAAFYFAIRFIRTGRSVQGIIAAALAALSFVVKSNGTIALIAIAIIIVITFIRAVLSKAGPMMLKCALVLLLLIILPFGLRGLVNGSYTARSGMPVPGGVPAAAYFAMGLEESEDKFGWYNGDNARYINDAGGDTAAASEKAMVRVKERLSYFLTHPKAMLRFYGKKFLQQWADPTKLSLREQELTGRHQEGMRPDLADSLTFGMGFLIMQGVMHIFHVILYMGACVRLVSLVMKKDAADDAALMIILFVLGGMMFHEIWEASGRYTLRYELAILPFAAGGIQFMSDAAEPVINRIRKGKTGT